MLKSTIFSPGWWIGTFLSTLVTMCFIVMIKKIGQNVPVLGTVTEQV